MAITFFSIQQLTKTLKVTIQKTGRLGFTSQTAAEMKLDANTYFLFGKDDSIPADLIMVKLPGASNDAFRAVKSGEYYYLATTPLFDMLGYDYKKEPVIFDVRRDANLDEEAGGEVYLLNRRASKGRRASQKKEPTVSGEKERTLFDVDE